MPIRYLERSIWNLQDIRLERMKDARIVHFTMFCTKPRADGTFNNSTKRNLACNLYSKQWQDIMKIVESYAPVHESKANQHASLQDSIERLAEIKDLSNVRINLKTWK
jgi:hypothetical protein